MGKRKGNKRAAAHGGASLRDMLREGQEAGKAGKGASRHAGMRLRSDKAEAPASLHLEGDPHRRIAVIGGGAAGLAAAIAAAQTLHAEGRFAADAVVLFEADDRVGRPILATGNGRCNFSNARIDARRYRNAGFVAQALASLEAASGHAACAGPGAPNAVLRFFERAGLAWREEGEGRLYPATGKASTVLDVLRAAAARLGVVEACGHRAAAVEPPSGAGGLFHIRFSDGAIQHAAAVVLAVGGKHALGLQPNADGGRLLPGSYAIVPPLPVLGPLAVAEAAPKQLDNIRVRARVTLAGFDGAKAVERGEVLFRSYGVSGICIFNLSRFAEPGDKLLIDFLPAVEEGAREGFLVERSRRLAEGGLVDRSADGVSNEALLRGLLLSPVARAVLKQAGLALDAPFREEDAPALARALSAFPLTVEGIGDKRQCQVLRGGLDAGCFDPSTMESRMDGGLFAAGEALDVDAPCGGCNLHWAWASGLLAGMSAAQCACGQGVKPRESEDADA